MSYLDDVARKREEAAQKKQREAELRQSLDTAKMSSNMVASEVASQGQQARSTTQKVEVTNDLAKKDDIDAVIAQLKEVQLASLLGGQNKPSVILSDSTDLGEKVATLGVDLKNILEAIKSDNKNELSDTLSSQFKQLADSLKSAIVSQSKEMSKSMESVNATLQSKDFNPNIKVDVPEQPEVTLDLSSVEASLKSLESAIKANKVVIPKSDYSALETAVSRVEVAINGLQFPVPNYVLPYKDVNGKATQVTLDSNGKIPVAATTTVDTTGLATDSNQTSGAQKTQIVDAGGEAVTVTGGKLDVNASVDTTGLATSAKQDTGNTSLASIDTKTPALGQALAAASVPVVLTAAQLSTITPPAAITGFATSAAQTDKSQFTKLTDGTDTALITAAGEQNVIATAQPGVDIGDVTINNTSGASAVNIQDGGNSITVDNGGTFAVQATLAAETTKVIGTVNQGTSPWVTSNATTSVVGNGTAATAQRVTLASDSTGQVTLASGANTIGALTANQSVNVAQMNGTTVTMGNGTAGTGVQRVTIASDSTGQVALAAGSALVGKVGIDQTTPGTTNAVVDTPVTSGGLSIVTGSVGATATAIKASAGQLYGYHLFNTTAAVAYVQIFNVAAASVTLGTTTPTISIGIPASGGVTVNFDKGIAFGTAISFACTTTRAGSSGATCDVNFFYK